MKDRSLIDKINLTFSDLTVMAIQYCLSAWKTDEYRVLPDFAPGGRPQRGCDIRNINHEVNIVCTDEFHRLNTDFRSSSPDIQGKMLDNIRSMIRRSVRTTGMEPAMAQPHYNQGSIDEHLLHYIPAKLIEQPNNLFNRLSSFVAGPEASMRFPAFHFIGGSAIASRSQPVPCSGSNSNINDIPSINNMTSVENTGLVIGSTIIDSAMLLSRWGMVWVIRLRISFVCYYILAFVNISKWW